MRIGLICFRNEMWHGGSIYIENLARLLEGRADLEPVMVVEEDAGISSLKKKFASYEFIPLKPVRRHIAEAFNEKVQERKLEIARRRELNRFQRFWTRPEPLDPLPERLNPNQYLKAFVQEHDLDLLFPLPPLQAVEVPGLCWIPDFQHRFLPENFSPEEIQTREERFAKMAEMPDLLLSSEDCRAHFVEAYPQSRTTVSIWRFCSLVQRDGFGLDTEEVRSKYHLPEEYFLVANQFWKHKDHAVVLAALVRLQGRVGLPQIVFTGGLRCGPDVSHIDEFLQNVQECGLHENVRILGFLSREEQLALMRRAKAVIQPSRFEGWSTVVEDCRAIGQRLILSDLRVHREQDPPYAKFFSTGDAESLAQTLQETLLESAGEWEKGRAFRERTATTMMNETEKKVSDEFAAIARDVTRRNREKGVSVNRSGAPSE